MKRRLCNYLAFLSLFLSLAVAALGIRSWFVPDEFRTTVMRDATSTVSVTGVLSSRGSLVVFWRRIESRPDLTSLRDDGRWYSWEQGVACRSAPPTRFGFLWLHDISRASNPSKALVLKDEAWWIGLPHALVWLLTTLLPARWAIRWWRERQKSAAGFPVESSTP